MQRVEVATGLVSLHEIEIKKVLKMKAKEEEEREGNKGLFPSLHNLVFLFKTT